MLGMGGGLLSWLFNFWINWRIWLLDLCLLLVVLFFGVDASIGNIDESLMFSFCNSFHFYYTCQKLSWG